MKEITLDKLVYEIIGEYLELANAKDTKLNLDNKVAVITENIRARFPNIHSDDLMNEYIQELEKERMIHVNYVKNGITDMANSFPDNFLRVEEFKASKEFNHSYNAVIGLSEAIRIIKLLHAKKTLYH